MTSPQEPTNPTGPTQPGDPVGVTDDSPWQAAPADPWAHEAPIEPWAGPGLAPTTGGIDTVDEAHPAVASAPLPGQRPNRRRLLVIGAAAVALVLVAAAATAVVWWRSRDGAVTFHQLSNPKSVGTDEENPSFYYARTAVTDKRGYLAWISGDNVRILGAELATEAPVKPVTVGPGDEIRSLVPVDDALVLVLSTYSPSSRAIYVIDAATLKTRWHRTLGADEWVETFPSYVLLIDPDADRVRKVDVKGDGSADGWNQQFAGASFRVAYPTGDLSAPAWVNGWPLAATADRSLLISKDSVVDVYDPATGEKRNSINGVPSSSNSALVVDNVYYAVRSDLDGYQVQAFDLTGKKQPTTIYTAEPKVYLNDLYACGGGVCVTQTTLGGTGTKVIALPTGDGTKPRWTLDVSDVDGITPIGEDTMIVDTTKAHTWIVGKDGTVRYDREARLGTRVTGGSVLLWSGLGTSAESVGLEGYTVADASAQPLGTADDILAARCTWSTTVLLCPAGGNLAWWTFAD
ncbi:hypothetical protein GCM10009682_18340 [Luedemannella flava]|uniref:Pyrroloquinoline-quinone binding quinoprotein n=1 Tax=Luedemannella flava TaxID=349316 RepID=A0ABN2LQS1_9ACTN